MGHGASTQTITAADEDLYRQKSGRSLGQAYRAQGLGQQVDPWTAVYRVSKSAAKLKLASPGAKLKAKQKALAAHSVVGDIDAKIKADKEAKDAEDAQRAAAEYAEKRFLSKAWHKVDSTRKYFTKAKNFVSVSVFLSHEGEYVVAATRPHDDAVIHPIHFDGADLPTATPVPDDPSLDELRNAPVFSASARDCLLKGNRLTIARGDSENELVLEVLGVPHRPAADVVSPTALKEVERQTLEAWEPTPTTAMQKVTDARFAALVAGLETDLLVAESAIVDVEAVHEVLVREARELHEMNARDAAVLATLPVIPKKRRKAAPHHRVVDRWDTTSPSKKAHRAATTTPAFFA